MKKTISIILAGLFCLSVLCACEKKKAEDKTPAVNLTKEYYEDFDYSSRLNDDGTFKDVRALDYVTLGEYKQMKIPADVTDITDKMIQDEIDVLLKNYAEDEKIYDKTVANGDTLNISYVGMIDGVAFDGGTSPDGGVEITVGKTQYIDDFIDQLIGHKPGDRFNVEVTFPDDYEKVKEGTFTVNGKDAVFDVTVNYIIGEKDVLPELTDKFVTENFGDKYKWNTVSGLKKGIKDLLLDQAVSSYIHARLLADCKISEVPDVCYIYQTESMLAYYTKAAKQNDMDFEAYTGKTFEELVADGEEKNKKQAKFSLIIQAIYESDPELKFNEKDVDEFITGFYSGRDPSVAKEQYGQGYVSYVVLNEKVIDYIKDNLIYEDPELELNK